MDDNMPAGSKNLEDIFRDKLYTWSGYNISSDVIEPEMEVSPEIMAKELVEAVIEYMAVETTKEIRNSLLKRRS